MKEINKDKKKILAKIKKLNGKQFLRFVAVQLF